MSPLDSARICFAGTPAFAVPCLDALLGAGARIDCVLTRPDRPAGRGRRPTASPVKALATGRGLAVLQPERLEAGFAASLPAEPPELLVVVAYGLVLPEWLLDWPRVAAVNVHASLLPRWRGAAPIQQAILAGDERTGVSIMRMTRGLDCGPVFAERAVEIGAAETAGELHDRLAAAGAKLLVEVLPGILDGSLEARPQDESGACYAPKIDKRDARLDFTQPAEELARRVRAFNPWPVAEALTADGRRLRIFRADAREGGVSAAGGAITAGTIAAARPEGIDVATGRGVLRLTEVQTPGGRAMSAAAWLKAHTLDGTAFVGR